MLKLSACVETLFVELDFCERIRKVSELGIPAFEFWGWKKKDIDSIRKVKDKEGLKVASMSAGEGGTLIDPANRGNYLQNLEESCKCAHELGCPALIVVPGEEVDEPARREQKKSIIDGLRAAAEIVEREKLLLVLEPLNILVDHAGQFLSSSLEAFEIVKEAGSASVKVLFDIYHQQVTEGNLTANIRDHIDLIGHFHVADVPGRHEPGTGEINYVNLFREIERTGYQGYVGLEYLPLGEVEEPLRKVIDIAKAASLKVES